MKKYQIDIMDKDWETPYKFVLKGLQGSDFGLTREELFELFNLFLKTIKKVHESRDDDKDSFWCSKCGSDIDVSNVIWINEQTNVCGKRVAIFITETFESVL